MFRVAIFVLLTALCRLSALEPEVAAKNFIAFMRSYNEQALKQTWALDLEKVFCHVDSKYNFRPREHNYLFEFDIPVPLEMRKQFIAYSFLKPGDTALDVGAFLGTYSFYYSSLVTDRGHVIAFEASPAPFYPLQEMLRQRGHSNISLRQQALSRTFGQTVVMEVHPGTLYQSSTLETALMHRTAGASALVEVETESLDRLLLLPCMAKLKLIKIDTEGHETAVLEGGRELIRSLKPVIIFEFGTDPGVFEPRSIEIMEEMGYVCYDLMSMKRVRPGYQHLTGTDLLGIPVERLKEFERRIKPVLMAIH